MKKEYLAVRLEGGISILNNLDELGALIDNEIPHEVLGEVCDSVKFGDNCMMCPVLKAGACRFLLVTDMNGRKWHVISDAILNGMSDAVYSLFKIRKKK